MGTLSLCGRCPRAAGQNRHPGCSAGQNRDPGRAAGQNRPPGRAAGQNRDPGRAAGQDRDPGCSAGQNRDPGCSAGQNRDPGRAAGQNHPLGAACRSASVLTSAIADTAGRRVRAHRGSRLIRRRLKFSPIITGTREHKTQPGTLPDSSNMSFKDRGRLPKTRIIDSYRLTRKIRNRSRFWERRESRFMHIGRRTWNH